MSLFRAATIGIGVDFGTSFAKVVQLQGEKARVSLTTYAVAQQPNPLVGGSATDAVARAAVLLREMLRRAGVSKGPVTAALPILSVFSTVLELPEMPSRDMEAAVTFAARNYVPSPLQDIVLGWTPIGRPRPLGSEEPRTPEPSAPSGAEAGEHRPSFIGERPASERGASPPSPTAAPRPDQPTAPPAPPGASVVRDESPPEVSIGRTPKPATRNVQEIFLTAAPRDLVNRYTSLFERLGISLNALEVESFPLARSLLRGEARPVLLVDLGDRTTSFSIVDGGYLRLNQAVDIGGSSLTAAIKEKLAITAEEAEKRKQAEGLGQGDAATPLAAAIRPTLTDLIQRGEVLRRLYERKKARMIGKVVLIGGGARLFGLTNLWASVSGLPTEVGNPWRGLTVPSTLAERLRALGPSFAVAVGLALRPFEKS